MSNILEGKWIYSDDLECPDVLEFASGGSYIVYNDCGAIDPLNPIIEKGMWKFEPKDSILTLHKRTFISPNSVFSETMEGKKRYYLKLKNILKKK